MRQLSVLALGISLIAAFGLAGCGMGDTSDKVMKTADEERKDVRKYGSMTGEGGLFNLGGKSKSDEGSGGGGIGVNSFLWRASLDTIAFMPLASADPFGGVIITDWFTPSTTPNERFKVTVYILDRVLRADAVRVAAFRQVRAGDQWQDAAITAKTQGDLEDAILVRARQLRQQSAGL
jgi:hypothetical protein